MTLASPGRVNDPTPHRWEGRGRHQVRPVAALAMVTMWLAACGGGRTLPSSAAPPRATVPPVPTTTFSPITTTTAEPGHWPRRTITGTGTVQDIAPTSQALYWLVVTTPASAAFMTVTPVRDDLGSLQMTGGSPLTGVVGSPALTVTGGWVWVVIGQGPDR